MSNYIKNKYVNINLFTLIFAIAIAVSCKKQDDIKKTPIESLAYSTTSIKQATEEAETQNSTHIGTWEITQRVKIDGWKTGTKYYYTQNEFEKKYQNLKIDINEQYVTIAKPFYCSGDYKIVAEKEMMISGTPQEKLNSFLLKELNINPDSYIGTINTNCKYPLTKIYVFKEHLIFQEYGAFFYVLSKQMKSKIKDEDASIKICKVNDVPNEYVFREICEYKKITDFNSLYTDYLKTNNSDLLPNLPKKDTLYKTSSTPEIKYSIKKNIVEVNIISEGGETTLKIYNSKGKGIVEVIKSPD